ncbi:putative reverse transcriptase domain-containing protein [Tanacetum coccineum]
MLIDHEYVNCPLRFDDRIRPANLLPIHMLDFDVILGMDWLASHRATIDCYARTVIFGNVCQPEFVYHGSSPLKSVKLISAMKAGTLISHGCQGFLASVMDTSLESPNIENLSVVPEFADLSVREQDILTTDFRTSYGHYESWLCPSSELIAPDVFMDLMNRIFTSTLTKFIIVFIDVILVFYSKVEESMSGTSTNCVRDFLDRSSVCEVFEKWSYGYSECILRGNIVSADRLHYGSSKLSYHQMAEDLLT